MTIRWRRRHHHPEVLTIADENGNGYFASGEIPIFHCGSIEEAMRKLDAEMKGKYPAHNCELHKCQQWHESNPLG